MLGEGAVDLHKGRMGNKQDKVYMEDSYRERILPWAINISLLFSIGRCGTTFFNNFAIWLNFYP